MKAYRNGTGAPFKRPVIPGEDIFALFDAGRLNHFTTKLDEVAVLARKAINETDEGRARRIWQKVFGDLFEAPTEVEASSGQATWTAPAIIGTSGKAA